MSSHMVADEVPWDEELPLSPADVSSLRERFLRQAAPDWVEEALRVRSWRLERLAPSSTAQAHDPSCRLDRGDPALSSLLECPLSSLPSPSLCAYCAPATPGEWFRSRSLDLPFLLACEEVDPSSWRSLLRGYRSAARLLAPVNVLSAPPEEFLPFFRSCASTVRERLSEIAASSPRPVERARAAIWHLPAASLPPVEAVAEVFDGMGAPFPGPSSPVVAVLFERSSAFSPLAPLVALASERTVFSGARQLSFLPEPLARRVLSPLDRSGSGYLLPAFPAPLPIEVCETALSLWDPTAPGQLSSFASALSAARRV